MWDSGLDPGLETKDINEKLVRFADLLVRSYYCFTVNFLIWVIAL